MALGRPRVGRMRRRVVRRPMGRRPLPRPRRRGPGGMRGGQGRGGGASGRISLFDFWFFFGRLYYFSGVFFVLEDCVFRGFAGKDDWLVFVFVFGWFLAVRFWG